MKKLNFYFLLVLFFVSFNFLFKNENVKEKPISELELRDINVKDFYDTEGNFLLSITEYLDLSSILKKDIWLHKVNFIENQDLDVIQSQYLSNLKTSIIELPSDTFYLTSPILNNAILLANVFSESDFINSFSNLDLIRISDLDTPKCMSCIDDLQNERNRLDDDNVAGMASNLPKCNCRWFCSDPIGGCNDCEAGDYEGCCAPGIGCGFLLLQDCTGHDQPCAMMKTIDFDPSSDDNDDVGNL